RRERFWLSMTSPTSGACWRQCSLKKGIRSSPVVDTEGNIIFGSRDGSVRSLNGEGRLNWVFPTGGDVDSSPAVDRYGCVYVGSDDGNVYSILKNGSLNWKYKTGSWVYSSPAIGPDGIVYVGSDDNHLYSFDTDGSLKWKYNTGNDVYSSPAVSRNGMIVIGSDNDTLSALDSDGTLIWDYDVGEDVFSSPAIDLNGMIYFGAGNGDVYCLNENGSKIWSFITGGPISSSSPAIGANGTVYIGSTDGNLYGIGRDTGPPVIFHDDPGVGPTTGEKFTFRVKVWDDNFVEGIDVSVRYWIAQGRSILVQSNSTMKGSGEDRYLDIYITNDSDNLQYEFIASDRAGHFSYYPGHGTREELAIIDNDPPVISDFTISRGTTGDPFTFDVTVTDNLLVRNVAVTWSHGSNGGIEQKLLGTTNSCFELTVMLDQDIAAMSYSLMARDASGNIVSEGLKLVEVLDNDDPVILNRCPPNGTTGDVYNFQFEVRDNIAISNTRIEYWFGEGEHHDITLEGEGNLSRGIILPPEVRDQMRYILSAVDTSGNRYRCGTSNVTILDNDPPQLVADRTPSNATTGDPFRFDIEVIDNTNISTSVLEYWFGEGPHSNRSFSSGSPGSLELIIPQNSTDPLHYRFHIMDGSGNLISTDAVSVEVLDNDPPFVDIFSLPGYGTTGEEVLVDLSLFDNIGISYASVEYWFDGDPVKEMISDEGVRRISIEIPEDSLSPLFFRISARDAAGNLNETQARRIPVMDNDPPVILDDNTPSSVIAGTELAVSVEASDNIVIDTAYVEYWYAGTERLTSVLEIGPILETTIEIPADAEGPLLYMIILVDSSGIRTEGETMTVEIERGPVDADQNVALYAFLGLVSSAAFAIIILFLLLLLRRSGKVRSGGEE
ncbi:MAG: PQQ-binding-like beta-propeller repeat protein, partial [Thermoplasmatota archaeon]